MTDITRFVDAIIYGEVDASDLEEAIEQYERGLSILRSIRACLPEKHLIKKPPKPILADPEPTEPIRSAPLAVVTVADDDTVLESTGPLPTTNKQRTLLEAIRQKGWSQFCSVREMSDALGEEYAVVRHLVSHYPHLFESRVTGSDNRSRNVYRLKALEPSSEALQG